MADDLKHQIIDVYARFSKMRFFENRNFVFPSTLKFETAIVLELRLSLRYLSDVVHFIIGYIYYI